MKSSSKALILATCAALVCVTTTVAQESKAKKLKDGETAVISTPLSEADATAKVKAYFNSKNIDFTVSPDTGRITSDWYNERGCSFGGKNCANRASVRVVSEQGQTVLKVQVFERSRGKGIHPTGWAENSNSKGKETAEFAATIGAYMSGQ